ncbi:hypothetical protein [Arenimonas sp. MALMAid1274]|uniref:hypothetical protein n=1 Tax=Arenimonas sp. MALMAid1274 TaxID=3411630 RepID=UPI003B9E920C
MEFMRYTSLVALVLAAGCASSVKESASRSDSDHPYLETAIRATGNPAATCSFSEDARHDERLKKILASRDFTLKDHAVEADEGGLLYSYYLLPNGQQGVLMLTVLVRDGKCREIDFGWLVT